MESSPDASRKPDETHDLPPVLLLQRPPAFSLFGDDFFKSNKFRFLKAYDSPLPLPEFLVAHSRSVPAILSSGGAPVTSETIRLMPALRVVVTTSAGLDQVDLAECRRRGIAVANVSNIASEDVADFAVGLLIQVLRRVSGADRYVRQGRWPSAGEYPLGSKLSGKRIGIVGLGNIGSLVAKRLEGFDCRISYNSRTRKQSVAYPFYPHVRELAANSDALVICCALTEQTRHMIDRDVFSALGKQGVIVNVGRGAIIDEKEMVRCLLGGSIAGAALDVFEAEPDVPKELIDLDNVVMTPHNAAFTSEIYEKMRRIVVGNLEAFFANQPLLTQVAWSDS